MLPKPHVMTTAELGAYMFKHHSGPANAIPHHEIAARLGFTDLGAFTELADKAVEERIPIIYNSAGYFYALNQSDFDYIMDDCKAHVRDWTKTVDAAVKCRDLRFPEV